MARAALAMVHPASTSRIERKAEELDAVNAQLKQLTERKVALAGQLLVLVEREGEADDDGKLRYATDAHKFVVIETKNVTCSGKAATAALIRLGLNAKLVKKGIAKATKETPYKYVRVDKASAVDDPKVGIGARPRRG